MAKLLNLLIDWIVALGPYAYAGLLLIVFIETGVVVMPFLPGDSLLFTVGALVAAPRPPFSLAVLYPVTICAALVGDNCNYWLGRRYGRSLFQNEKSKLFQRENLDKTEAFFARHGGKAVILARFVPIVRTFAPFVAGMGAMTYSRFLLFSVAGAGLWAGVCITAGFLFGNMPIVKKNFEIVIVGIIAVSLLPMVVEFLKHRKESSGSR